MGLKNGVSRALLCGLALAGAVPAAAQFSDSYNFLKAVRDADGTKATELLSKPGAPVVNTRDPSTGETALHIVIKQHNDNWVAFLLNKGALPDQKDRQGNTPLHVAALSGDATASNYLLSQRAKVDPTNNNGETPLILAVHRKDLVVTRLLIEAGANPALADTIAGKSALDYAKDDPRGAALVKVLAEGKAPPKKAISGPVL